MRKLINIMYDTEHVPCQIKYTMCFRNITLVFSFFLKDTNILLCKFD